MSRPVQTDHEFNPERFAILIKKAMGNRTQAEYAEQSHVSLSYINRFSNMKLSAPPIPSTIKKLASCAENNVSYEELMNAAGYDPDMYMEMEGQVKPYRRNQSSKYEPGYEESAGLTAIYKGLSLYISKWKNVATKDREFFDCILDIDDTSELNKWCFKFLSGSKAYLSERVYYLFGKLSSISTYEPNMKVSIVTFTNNAYEFILKNYGTILPVYISVILVDIAKTEIIEEEYLYSGLKATDEILNHFTFRATELH